MVELSGDLATTRIADAPRRGELVSVQYLRAIASLFVVAWHASVQVGVQPFNFYQGGIEFFFLISGFVIWTISVDKPPSPGLFLKRRLARVAPFYWAITTLVVVLLLVAPGLFQTLRLVPAHVLASYLFIPMENPAPGVGIRPLVIPGWTLNVEMLFYLLFALALALPRRGRGLILSAMILSFAAAGLFLPKDAPVVARFYTSHLMVEMAAGVLLALAVERFGDPRPGLAALMLGLGAVLFVFGGSVWSGEGPTRLILLGLPAAMVLIGAVALDRAGRMPCWTLPKALGDASYALYMIHPLMLSAMIQLWRRTGAGVLPGWLFVVLALAATGAAGILVHAFVERPLTAWLQYRLKLTKARPSLALPFGLSFKSAR